MLSIQVNGCKERVHIGCRSMIALKELLGIIEIDSQKIALNGQVVPSGDFERVTVKSGDKLKIG